VKICSIVSYARGESNRSPAAFARSKALLLKAVIVKVGTWRSIFERRRNFENEKNHASFEQG
jgi:hypothetical protein